MLLLKILTTVATASGPPVFSFSHTRLHTFLCLTLFCRLCPLFCFCFFPCVLLHFLCLCPLYSDSELPSLDAHPHLQLVAAFAIHLSFLSHLLSFHPSVSLSVCVSVSHSLPYTIITTRRWCSQMFHWLSGSRGCVCVCVCVCGQGGKLLFLVVSGGVFM